MALPVGLLVKGGIGVTAVVAPISAFVIHNEMKKSRLREENKKLNVKITALGITDTTCHFEDTKDKAECELVEAKVKAINFTNKTNSDLTVSGLDANKKLKLVIEKGYQDSDFPEGLRFIFKNPQESGDITIGATGNQTTLKPGISYDFKIKTETNNEIKLEKAWTIETLGAKVGLTCTNGDTTSECTLKTSGINVWKAEDDYMTGATQTDTTKKMTVTKDTKDHNGGFKFTVTSDISLTPGTQKKTTGGINKLTQTSTNSTTYEIDLKDDNGTKKWFLIEKSTSS